jgi:hypothetical protein
LYVVINAAQASLELAAATAQSLRAANSECTRPQLREAMFPGYHSRGIKIDVHESLIDRSVDENWRTLAGFALITIVARYESVAGRRSRFSTADTTRSQSAGSV